MNKKTAKNVDNYISRFPKEVQQLLKRMRMAIRKAAPGAKEKISYGVPTFVQGRNLVHFAAYERHIGFYPGAAPTEAFKRELSAYKTAKGSVQFPIDRPLPLDLVDRMVKFRVKQRLSEKKARTKR